MIIAHTSFTEFSANCELARRHGNNVVPVSCRIAFDTLTPVLAYLRLRPGSTASALLESVTPGRRSRYSYVAVNPRDRYELVNGVSRLTTFADDGDNRQTSTIAGAPLEVLREYLGRHRTFAPAPGVPPLTGGWIGYLGYEVVRQIEPTVPPHRGQPLGVPDACLDRYDCVLVIDHFTNQADVVVNVELALRTPEPMLFTAAARHIAAVLERLQRPVPEGVGRACQPVPIAASSTPAAYQAAVGRVLEHLRAGDTFQTVLAQHFSVPLQVSSLDLYRALRQINPSPYMFHLDFGQGAQLVGASPEVLVEVTDGVVRLRPIAGTRRRGATPEEDERLERELMADAKELAEHRMLVDLARNDVGRVAQPGTVEVVNPEHVEHYSHVMHIVSDVVGRLRPDRTPLDALLAGFPAGTLTGAPKVRAMQIVAELEPVPRGPYGGGVGYLGFDGNLDFCITIRSMVISQGVAHFHAGAGIVLDSDPAKEYRETMDKAAALSAALALTGNSPKLTTGATA